MVLGLMKRLRWIESHKAASNRVKAPTAEPVVVRIPGAKLSLLFLRSILLCSFSLRSCRQLDASNVTGGKEVGCSPSLVGEFVELRLTKILDGSYPPNPNELCVASN